MPKQTLTKLELSGFKSIRTLTDLTLGKINVLVGANGSGKSNLISFFKLLNWMTPSPGNLQLHIGKTGGAHTLLHDGPDVTPQMVASMTFATDAGCNQYYMRLFHAAEDTLIFADEKFRFSRRGWSTQADWISVGSGHRESKLVEYGLPYGEETARTILKFLKQCVVYQFHNTSETARMRQKWSVGDNRFLKEDAANLAPFLYRLRESRSDEYLRIVETIRQIAPFFADFVLEPEDDSIMLQWRELGSDVIFGPHQASDGTLRAMALITLLLQPEEDLPAVVILDEPELGLHPYAIHIVAGLLRSISNHVQVILATQSMTLIDHFDPEDIIVVDRAKRESTFTRLDRGRLKDWLDEYSMAELWEKNVIGGRP